MTYKFLLLYFLLLYFGRWLKNIIVGTYCWSNHKIELMDVSYYNKKENMRQSLVLHSLLLPNSATKLHEPYIDISRIPDDVSK